MQLPDVNGIKTIAMLKQNSKTARIPVVACTLLMSAVLEKRASEVGISTFLIKPVSPQTLKETIVKYTNRVPNREVQL